MTDKKSKIRTKQKLYCYVDETGQDTKGKLFIVSLVVTGSEKDELENKLIKLENTSGKRAKKWQKARKKERLAYITGIIDSHNFRNKLFYQYFDEVGTKYYYFTIFSIANLFTGKSQFAGSQVIITIDAIDKRTQRIASAELRRFGIKTDLVRGKNDQSSALLRLADSTAGFVRDGIEKHPDYVKLYNKAKRENIIQQIK